MLRSRAVLTCFSACVLSLPAFWADALSTRPHHLAFCTPVRRATPHQSKSWNVNNRCLRSLGRIARGNSVRPQRTDPALTLIKMYDRPAIEIEEYEGVQFLQLGSDFAQSGPGSTQTARSISDIARDAVSATWDGPPPTTAQGMQWYSVCGKSDGESVISSEKISEIPLFSIGRVLLPDSDFPLQVLASKQGTQKMFRDLSPSFQRRQEEQKLPFNNIKREQERKANAHKKDTAKREEPRFGVVLARADAVAAVGCEAAASHLTSLDDGRLIVECRGQRRFRILDIVQVDPYPVAIVRWLVDEDEGAEDAEKGAAAEKECWRLLQDICWLCVEVWDKRAWVPLLMGETGNKHPLHEMRWSAPALGIPESIFKSDSERRKVFSWHMVRLLRNGIPGLWDHDLTESAMPTFGVQKLLETTNVRVRLEEALNVLTSAHSVLKLRQKLKNMADHRHSELSEEANGD